jgi:hypothetical protein
MARTLLPACGAILLLFLGGIWHHHPLPDIPKFFILVLNFKRAF